jgi:ABC-2 type transport system permease protein
VTGPRAARANGTDGGAGIPGTLASGGAGPQPPRAVTATLLFAGRALLKMLRLPEQMLDVVAIPILFTLMFTYLFGGAVAGSTGEYLHYLLPGTMVMTVLVITMYTGVALNTDLTSGVADRFRTLPVWSGAPVAGAVAADVVRYGVASCLVLVVGVLMGYRPAGDALDVAAALGLVVLFAVGVGWVFVVLAEVLRTPSGIFSVGTVVVFPLTFVSNTFVDPATVPGWLRPLLDQNPVSHLVSAVRALMDGRGATADTGFALLVALGLTLVLAPAAMALHRRAGASG